MSIVRDISSADDASTLVLDDPVLLILPFFSQNGDLDVRLFRRLDPGLICLLSSSSSLLEFEEFDSVFSLELEVPSSLSFLPDGDFELLRDLSNLNELFDSFFRLILFDDVLDGILNLDLLDFTELELDSDGIAG